MLMSTAEGLLDDGRRLLGPHEWGRMTVPLGDVALDVANQGPDRMERAAPDRLAGEDAEPRFHHVEPRRALGGEVKVDLRMRRQPRLHGGRGVRGGIVPARYAARGPGTRAAAGAGTGEN